MNQPLDDSQRRQAAMAWWNAMNEDDQVWSMMQAGCEKYGRRRPSDLTGREIQELWELLVKAQ